MGLRLVALYPSLFLACDSATVISERCFVDLTPISVRTKVLGVGNTVA
jgi:hypothetical protein